MGESARVWGALVLEIPSRMEEELIAWLAAESLGVELLPAAGDRTLLKVYVDSPPEAAERAAFAAALLEERALDPCDCGLRVESVADGQWVERFQAGLRPFPFAGGFVVHPAGGGEPAGGRTPIRLVPGRAFGTGEHPTTRLCAIELEASVRPGERWVDLGCGSAILSIVAHHCGAREVVGVDNDRSALAVAREVLRHNRLAGSIALVQGSAGSLAPAVWDGVVANIGAGFFTREAAALDRLLRAGGRLIASGFSDSDLPELRAAFDRTRLREVGRENADGWSVLRLVAEPGRRD